MRMLGLALLLAVPGGIIASAAEVPALLPTAGGAPVTDLAEVGAPFTTRENPLSNIDFLLLARNKFRFGKDGRVFSPGSETPIGITEMFYVLEDLRSRQRLKALLEIKLILFRVDPAGKLSPYDLKRLRGIARENWPLFEKRTRDELSAHLSPREVEDLDKTLPKTAPLPPPEDPLALATVPDAVPIPVDAPMETLAGPLMPLGHKAPPSGLPPPDAAPPPQPTPQGAAAQQPSGLDAAPPAPVAAPVPAQAGETPPPAAPAPDAAPKPAAAPAPAAKPKFTAQPAAPPPMATAPAFVPLPVPAAAVPTPAAAPPPPPAAPVPAPVVAPVVVPAVVAVSTPPAGPEPAAETIEYPDFSAKAFAEFMETAPYGRKVKPLLEMIARHAPAPERKAALGIVMSLLPHIVVDSGKAGVEARAAVSGLEDSPVPGRYQIALNDGPVLLRTRRMLKKTTLMLPDAEGVYAAYGAAMGTGEAFSRESASTREAAGDWGRTRIYDDGSARLSWSRDALAGSLLHALLVLDAELRGWDDVFHTRMRAVAAEFFFYRLLEKDTGTEPDLDRALAARYREWMVRPEDHIDFMLHAVLDAGVRADLLGAPKGRADAAAFAPPPFAPPGDDSPAHHAWLDLVARARRGSR